jgi:hypothetical protein
MDWIIIVDDQPENPAAFATGLGNKIEQMMHGSVRVLVLQGVRIDSALEDIRAAVQAKITNGDCVVGILVDYVDETNHIPDGGKRLLQSAVNDPVVRNIPISIYTSRHTEICIPDIIAIGARAVIPRPLTGLRVYERVAGSLLRSFNITIPDQV